MALALGALAPSGAADAAPAASLQRELDALDAAPGACRAPRDRALADALADVTRRLRPVEARLRTAGRTARGLEAETVEAEAELAGRLRDVQRLRATLGTVSPGGDRKVVTGVEQEIRDAEARVDASRREVRQRYAAALEAARQTDALEQQLTGLVVEERALRRRVEVAGRAC